MCIIQFMTTWFSQEIGGASMAGTIHAWLDGNMSNDLRYGVTPAAMALSQLGDMPVTNKTELEKFSQAGSTLLR